MTTTRDLDQLITAWLEADGARDLGAGRLEATFAVTSTTRQRRRSVPLLGPRPWPRAAGRATASRLTRGLVLLALGALLLAALALAAVTLSRPAERPRTLAIVHPDGVYLAGRDGTREHLVLPGSFVDVAWSPDGSHLVAVEGPDVATTGAVVLDADGALVGRFDGGGTGLAATPAWSPDGRLLISQLPSPHVLGGFVLTTVQAWRLDGTLAWETTLPTTAGRQWRQALTTAWRPDGAWVAVDLRRENDLCHETVLVPATAPDHATSLFEDAEADLNCVAHRPAWSPDGRRLALLRSHGSDCWPWYPDDSACHSELVVYELGDAEPTAPRRSPRVVSVNERPSSQPLWLPDGSALLVSRLTPAGRESSVDVSVVRADGSGERHVTTLETHDPELRWAEPGTSFLFRAGAGSAQWPSTYAGDLDEVDLASGRTRTLAREVLAAALQP